MAEKLDTQVRREQIARATLELAAAGGLKKVNVAAVARRVGVVPSALYRHFRGMDQVLDATIDLIHQKLQENVQAVHAETDDPLDRLHGLLQRHVRLIRENRGIPQIMFAQDFFVDHPERRRRVYRGIRAYLDQVAQLVRDAQSTGQVAVEVDPDAASVLFLGLIQPSAILWHMSDGEFDVTRQARNAWPLFRKALQDPNAAGTVDRRKQRSRMSGSKP